jgi:hypothetical protein
MLLGQLTPHDIHHFLLPLLSQGGGGGGDVVPNPAPSLPPGLGPSANKLVSWAKGAVDIIALLSFFGCAAMIMAGLRNRGQVATEGAIGAGRVLAALAVVGSASVLVRSFAF